MTRRLAPEAVEAGRAGIAAARRALQASADGVAFVRPQGEAWEHVTARPDPTDAPAIARIAYRDASAATGRAFDTIGRTNLVTALRRHASRAGYTTAEAARRLAHDLQARPLDPTDRNGAGVVRARLQAPLAEVPRRQQATPAQVAEAGERAAGLRP